jgi:hypothetical protein
MPKKILIAVNSLEDAFKNSLTNKSTEVIYIKADDLKKWTENQGAFNSKQFGDHESGMSLTFIFKAGDQEFEQANLIDRILRFKKGQLLNTHI